MVDLKVRNPVALRMESRVDPAPRLSDLNGKRIGLYWNLKAGGDRALKWAEKLLAERYPEARFSHYRGTVGATNRHVTPKEADRISRECDAIIGTSSD